MSACRHKWTIVSQRIVSRMIVREECVCQKCKTVRVVEDAKPPAIAITTAKLGSET